MNPKKSFFECGGKKRLILCILDVFFTRNGWIDLDVTKEVIYVTLATPNVMHQALRLCYSILPSGLAISANLRKHCGNLLSKMDILA
jgi:hypothetical protein